MSFKAGDRVRLTGFPASDEHKYVGLEGTVREAIGGSWFVVDLDNDPEPSMAGLGIDVLESEIEYV